MFVGKASSLELSKSGTLKRCFIWIDSSLTLKDYTSLERPARDKSSSSLRTFTEVKCVITLGPDYTINFVNGRSIHTKILGYAENINKWQTL